MVVLSFAHQLSKVLSKVGRLLAPVSCRKPHFRAGEVFIGPIVELHNWVCIHHPSLTGKASENRLSNNDVDCHYKP